MICFMMIEDKQSMVTKNTTNHNVHKEKMFLREYFVVKNIKGLVCLCILPELCDLLKSIQNSFYSIFHKYRIKI